MRAAIVEREDMPALVDEKDGAMAAVHNESPFGFQLFEGARAHEIRGLSILCTADRYCHDPPVLEQSSSPL